MTRRWLPWLVVAATLWRLGPADAAPDEGWRVGLVLPRYLVAGGAESPLIAQVLDASGEPVADGTPVTFVASLGVVVEPVTAETQNGLATTNMRPGTEAGFARLDAVANGYRGEALLWVRPAAAASVAWLDAVPSRLLPGGRSVITGRLTDPFGNPAEGDEVRWVVDGGTLTESSPRVEHGEVRAVFTAGGQPGRGGVRVEASEAGGRVAILVADEGTDRPPSPVWLPLALADRSALGGCAELLSNGGFERDGDQDGVPDHWRVVPGHGPAPERVPDGAEGSWSVRLVGGGSESPPGLLQEIPVRQGANQAELWLWARGAPVGGGLRLAVWSTISVGNEAVRAPLLVQRVALPEASWERLAFRLPAPPSGATTVELSPWAEDASVPVVDVDGVALHACW